SRDRGVRPVVRFRAGDRPSGRRPCRRQRPCHDRELEVLRAVLGGRRGPAAPGAQDLSRQCRVGCVRGNSARTDDTTPQASHVGAPVPTSRTLGRWELEIVALIDRDTAFDRFAAREPYFSILTDPKFLRDRLTPDAEHEFFASGDAVVAWM